MSRPAQSSPPGTAIGKTYRFGLKTIMELFDVGPGVAITALTLSALVVVAAVVYFIRSAPPSTIVITSGPAGSVFHKNALKYAKILGDRGVKAKVVLSEGSLENLARLADRSSHVDVGIVQSGIPTPNVDRLVSLGAISHQPLLVFHVGKPIELLSELAGKKVAVGPVGSGTRNFALALLAANGIQEGGSTALLDLEAEEAAKKLTAGEIDAAFVMSESASTEILHDLLRHDGIQLFNFQQADAYSRKVDYLDVLELPEGAIDFGRNIPAHNVSLVGPMVELVATNDLNPALVDLVIEAATEVHSRPGVFHRRGEFPAPIEHAIPVSDEATRYYKSGKGFLYRLLPFWLASIVTRVVLVFVPVLVIVIPALRAIPAFFRWTTRTRIRRRYRELLTLERSFLLETDPVRKEFLRREFDRIDESVNGMKVRASFADQLYGLRVNIDYVRQVLAKRDA